ncbi:MAG: 4-(cytidine 5'-diphospho)-2-C-methyl-D-erythritol kinase [Sutterellaceae bacterium]|nr:4-(cytidine 5'-diphospho)-2-C-methyl-D-erythritol kinase [Sutterellaceae bacterium]MDD7441077.1 4-(cytidine 5'-diphospho)-2-C-methyl-D-erythritol kinase [Sutterellaceae bacterium]MDY2868936.1 4-(cytidine 5'-diphospho)-2-C-methyl-D-erythritol kinase [Mesosutterella sp.]
MTEASPENFLNLPAPAKINLFLHLVGRRADGYHLLQSVFLLVSLADQVDLGLRRDGAIRRSGDVAGDPERDLCVRAARLLRQKTGCGLGADIVVRKRIPAGAGLGGGSSDAATALIGLSRLWGLQVPGALLAEWGSELGADVPFFIRGRNALVEGIGEAVTPADVPEKWFALVWPGVLSATDVAFHRFDLTKKSSSLKISGLSELYESGRFSFGYGRNDLQPVVTDYLPAVRQAVEFLSRSGAARMTGSGAAVFLPCEKRADAERALEGLPEGWRGWTVRSLPSHPLLGWLEG